MEKRLFNFNLPEHLIAQSPPESRGSSRLLCMNRDFQTPNGSPDAFDHRHFNELPKLLRTGDCLVLNDSRVLPARLLGRRGNNGGVAEVLLLRETAVMPAGRSHTPAAQWECLVRPGKKIKNGTNLIFGHGELTATVKGVLESGNRLIEFYCDGIFLEVLERLGKMPLPPYIQTELQDAERYQTVYSRELGSAAAPTAGLHFTHELLDELKQSGIDICFVTLHVGLGTFRPVKTERIEDHLMHSEFYTIPTQTTQIVNRAKEKGGRVIAVGTTSCRTLESASDERGRISSKSSNTDIFIYPGYKFKCIDGLITNFHLPESTLIMLVSALAGRDRTLKAYEEAIGMEYRFYSFGDAMLIL